MTRPGLSTSVYRIHWVVVGVGVLLDVEVLLDLVAGVGQEGPLCADRVAELVGFEGVAGGDGVPAGRTRRARVPGSSGRSLAARPTGAGSWCGRWARSRRRSRRAGFI